MNIGLCISGSPVPPLCYQFLWTIFLKMSLYLLLYIRRLTNFLPVSWGTCLAVMAPWPSPLCKNRKVWIRYAAFVFSRVHSITRCSADMDQAKKMFVGVFCCRLIRNLSSVAAPHTALAKTNLTHLLISRTHLTAFQNLKQAFVKAQILLEPKPKTLSWKWTWQTSVWGLCIPNSPITHQSYNPVHSSIIRCSRQHVIMM